MESEARVLARVKRAAGWLLAAVLPLSACGGGQTTGPDEIVATEGSGDGPVEVMEDTVPPPPELEVSYDHVHRRTLDNGLEVVVVEQHAVPIVTVEMAVRNGAFTETPEFNGLSHLYEHMFFKANEVIPSQEEYLQRQREMGLVWNGTTGNERVNYFWTTQSHHLQEAMEFMADAIQTPLFLEEELVREREVVIGEYDRNEANPFYFLYDTMDDLLWYEYPSRKDSLGDRETILSATIEQMEWMQQTYYIPNNSLLVLAGDVTPEQGFALAEQIFGDWASGPDPFEAYPIPEHPPLTENVAAITPQEVQVSVVQFAWHGPDTRNDVDATYAADVFSFILGQGGSLFQQHLVDSGVALDASVGYSTNRYVGPIYFTLVVAPGMEAQAIEAAMAELAQFDDPEYYTDVQLQTAQSLLAVDDIYGQQETVGFAHTLTYWWASADIDYYLGYVDSLMDVTREDITRYVETYIQDQPMGIVLLASQQNIDAQGIDEAWLLNAVAGTEGE